MRKHSIELVGIEREKRGICESEFTLKKRDREILDYVWEQNYRKRGKIRGKAGLTGSLI